MRVLERFDGISGSLEFFIFVSESSLIILLKGGDSLLGTDLALRCGTYCEIDGTSLRRLHWSAKVVENCEKLPIEALIFGMHNGAFVTVDDTKQHSDTKPFDKLAFFALILSSVLYGGHHGLAFGIPFHSKAESLLWKISCLAVASGGILVLTLLPTIGMLRVMYHAIERYFKLIKATKVIKATKLYQVIDKKVRSLSDVHKRAIIIGINEAYHLYQGCAATLFLTPLFGCIVLYIFSRVYLVVEVFLNLPYVDPGVYQTPSWSVYWPHIT